MDHGAEEHALGGAGVVGRAGISAVRRSGGGPNPGTPRRWGRYVPALLLFGAALLSKTVTATLVGVLPVLIWWKRPRVRPRGRDFLPLLPFLVGGAVLGLNTARLEKLRVGAVGRDWDFSFVDRCLIAGRVVWFYALKVVLPVNLAFIYPRWKVDHASATAIRVHRWDCWPSCCSSGWPAGRIGRGPLAAVLCFIGMLFPALGFFNVYPMRFSFVADHFQYLAGMALIALLAAIGANIWHRLPDHLQRMGPLLAGLAIVTLGVTTALQCLPYRNADNLWTDTIAKNPRAMIAYLNLADVASQKGDAQRAIDLMEESVHWSPDDPKAWAGLGAMLSRVGRRDEAIRAYQPRDRDVPQARAGVGR